jgi:hypothetical protein
MVGPPKLDNATEAAIRKALKKGDTGRIARDRWLSRNRKWQCRLQYNSEMTPPDDLIGLLCSGHPRSRTGQRRTPGAFGQSNADP